MTPPCDFDRLARELIPSISRYLLRYVGDRALADDLLQETLVRISRGLPEFAGRSSLKTWAFAIATRVAADHFRAPERRLRMVEIEEAETTADGGEAADEKLILEEMNACIREVIDSLPEDYRAAVILHDLQGMSARQIARICETTLPVVKIRIHRARKRLRAALDRQCNFYRGAENQVRCDRK